MIILTAALLALGLVHQGQVFLVVEQPEAGLGDFRVVDPAAALLDFSQCLVDTQGGTLGAVRGHGIHHVGDGEDARFGQDFGITDAARIAAAVQSFMVLQDDGGHGPGELDILQHVVTGLGMALDQHEFGRAEAA